MICLSFSFTLIAVATSTRSPCKSAAWAQLSRQRAARATTRPAQPCPTRQHGQRRSFATWRLHFAPGHVRLPSPNPTRLSTRFWARLRPPAPIARGRRSRKCRHSTRAQRAVIPYLKAKRRIRWKWKNNTYAHPHPLPVSSSSFARGTDRRTDGQHRSDCSIVSTRTHTHYYY